MMEYPKRGEIWWVEFDPSAGTEIQKTRPALVISNNIANEKGSKVTIMPLTSTVREFPFTVIVEPSQENGLTNKSLVKVPDVCTFDKCRFGSKIGVLSAEKLNEIEKKLRLHLEL